MSLYKRIRIAGSENVIYVNDETSKGRQLVTNHGIMQPKITEIWRDANRCLQPDTILDIGVHYGEILFSTNYGKNTNIIGIESNKAYQSYLRRSLQEHPNNSQFCIEYASPSETSKVFNHILETRENTIKKLLFKMNSDRHNAHTLKEMEKTLNRYEEIIGIIEFNSIYLTEAGIDIEEYLTQLNERYGVLLIISRNKLVKLDSVTIANVKRVLNKPYIITNLLLLSHEKLLKVLGYHSSKPYLDRGVYFVKSSSCS